MSESRSHGEPRPRRLGARELVELFCDEGSYRSWDTPPVHPEATPDPGYAAELAAARTRSGVDEAVLTGEGRLRGRRVAIMAGEFAFLGGSIGVAAAERIVRAVERATAEGLPLLAAPVSGGTRMQEGTVAFVCMVKITAAITRHKQAGLPYLVYLRHPTTGGVLASWGSLGHVTVAEPGALIGFLGPRVYEALYDEPFPAGVQVAENLYEHGLLDAVLPPEAMPEIADRALNVLCAPREGLPYEPRLPGGGDAPGGGGDAPGGGGAVAPPPYDTTTADQTSADETLPDVPAWESITRSRRPQRPGVRHLLRAAAHDVIPLNGTGEGEADPGLLLALARFGVAPAILLGHDRLRQGRGAPFGPAGLREARRGIRLAHELGLPLVTVIDTPGAALSREAEEGGLAGEIARTLADLAVLRAPTVCVLLGQGSGGGALALVPADRVLAAQHGWLSPLPPEGASAILHRTTDRAAEMAASQGVRSADLLRAGIVDRIVPEHPDAAEEAEAFCRRLGAVLEGELVDLLRQPTDLRLADRHRRYRQLGLPHS